MKVHLFLICLTISAATSAGTFHSTDPECHMTAPQIIRYYGYQAEVHSVTTPDGYILQLHRYPDYHGFAHNIATSSKPYSNQYP